MEKVKKLANSKWIDELSEEEEEVLRMGHALDEKMKRSKSKPFKTGIFDGTTIEE
jgi:phosphate uptake regulator